MLIALSLVSFTLTAAPESSGKLAGTETAFIDDSGVTIGLMDTTVNLSKMISVKSNLLFDGIGLQNIGIKAGYHFKNLMGLRIAAGYTWFRLDEEQVLLDFAKDFAKDYGITINSLNLGIGGEKIYAAIMLPLFGFNIHMNYSLYTLANDDKFSRATAGIERTLLNNHLAMYANGGMFFDLPETTASTAAKSIYYNTLVTDLYADGGLRIFLGSHLNLDIGVIYPGMSIPMGDDPDSGDPLILDIPVIPVFNIAYRF